MGFYHRLFFYLIFTLFTAVSSAKDSIRFTATLSEKKSLLLLPVPNYLILLGAELQLFEKNLPVDIKYKVLNEWPTLTEGKNIRLLLIEVSHIPSDSVSLQLKWDNNKLNKTLATFSENKKSTLIFPSLNWLAKSLLLHPNSTVNSSRWYTEPQSYYGNYVTNNELLLKNGYPKEKASQWLFDRPQAIYQLFAMTGNYNWLNKGHELSDFYIKNINVDGSFKLSAKDDVKYLMPKGLLYKYFLSADPEAKQALKKAYQHSLKWDPEYTLERRFWTERNQAAALNTAISYWEVTGDNYVVERIDQIVDATVKMTFSPENDWALVGCPQHTLQSHEGQGGLSPSCSPWMMALLSDALWRYYRLTNDIRAASLIDAFGDFILNHGIYWGDKKVSNVVIPKYLAVLENSRYEYLDQWTDPQHTCDIAGLLGKSVYIKKINKVDDFLLKELFSEFVRQCKDSFERTKTKQKKLKTWTVTPPRRFNWMFSTTSDLPWLVDFLLVDSN
jgi:hypothetical protein